MSDYEKQYENLMNNLAEVEFEVPDNEPLTEQDIQDAERAREVMLNAVEVERRKQIFEVLNSAYDLTVEYAQRQNMNRDDFRKHFSGIADDYKMAKLRYEVAKDSVKN